MRQNVLQRTGNNYTAISFVHKLSRIQSKTPSEGHFSYAEAMLNVSNSALIF